MLLFAASCGKPDNKALLRETCDGLMGKYLCSSITFLGNPIDINGDGAANTDLIEEFKNLGNPMIAVNAYQRVYPASDYGEKVGINLEIPLQHVNFYKHENRYIPNINASSMHVKFSYSVDESGTVTFNVHNDENSKLWKEDDDEIERVDNMDTKGVYITRLKDGVLVAIIDCAYYDYSTEMYLKGPVEFVYERVASSLY